MLGRIGWLLCGSLLVCSLAACNRKTVAASEQATEGAPRTAYTEAAPSNISEEPQMVYCGNTSTQLRIGNVCYDFDGERSVSLTDLLLHLRYTEPLCNCLPDYTVDTEFGTDYGISLSEGYVRHGAQQVTLTKEQQELITEIVAWAKQHAFQLPQE